MGEDVGCLFVVKSSETFYSSTCHFYRHAFLQPQMIRFRTESPLLFGTSNPVFSGKILGMWFRVPAQRRSTTASSADCKGLSDEMTMRTGVCFSLWSTLPCKSRFVKISPALPRTATAGRHRCVAGYRRISARSTKPQRSAVLNCTLLITPPRAVSHRVAGANGSTCSPCVILSLTFVCCCWFQPSLQSSR